MKIGITEQGDAGLDLSWVQKIESNTVNGAILITKNLTKVFRQQVVRLHELGYKIIVHATTTGWGESPVEPNVPHFTKQIRYLSELIESGFPVEQCVLRIDPIIPTEHGLNIVKELISYVISQQELKDIRIRISVLDEYKHVKTRLQNAGYASFYPGDNFQANVQQMNKITIMLSEFNKTFETCAESKLTNKLSQKVYEKTGCISEKDLLILGLTTSNDIQNPQHRYGCHCLSCKYELLEHKTQCPHKCLYCYWKD